MDNVGYKINAMHTFLISAVGGQESISSVEWVQSSIHFFGCYSCFHSLMVCMDSDFGSFLDFVYLS